DKGGDVNYELYTLDYSKNVLEKITGPIGRIFYTFWISDDEWLVVGHEKETVYAKSLLRDGTMKDLYTTNEQILGAAYDGQRNVLRSEEHTSELQSRSDLVCRLLLEKKKKKRRIAGTAVKNM